MKMAGMCWCDNCDKDVTSPDDRCHRLCPECNHEIGYSNYRYDVTCGGCGEVLSVYSQLDDNPEYYHDVRIKCLRCANMVTFTVAVN